MISQKVVEAGNLKDYVWGVWFMKGLLFEYWRYIMAKTGANLDKCNLFDFCRLKKAIKDQFNASKGVDWMSLENSKKTGIK